jgi:hypothetical protein
MTCIRKTEDAVKPLGIHTLSISNSYRDQGSATDIIIIKQSNMMSSTIRNSLNHEEKPSLKASDTAFEKLFSSTIHVGASNSSGIPMIVANKKKTTCCAMKKINIADIIDKISVFHTLACIYFHVSLMDRRWPGSLPSKYADMSV